MRKSAEEFCSFILNCVYHEITSSSLLTCPVHAPMVPLVQERAEDLLVVVAVAVAVAGRPTWCVYNLLIKEKRETWFELALV